MNALSNSICENSLVDQYSFRSRLQIYESLQNLKDPKLFSLLAFLARFAKIGVSDCIFPSNAVIAESVGIDVRTLQRWKNQAIDLGLIYIRERVVRTDNGSHRQTSNCYYFTHVLHMRSILANKKQRYKKTNKKNLLEEIAELEKQIGCETEIVKSWNYRPSAKHELSRRYEPAKKIKSKKKKTSKIKVLRHRWGDKNVTGGGDKMDTHNSRLSNNINNKNIYTPKDTISGDVSREVSKKELNSLKPEQIDPEFHKIAKEYSQVTGRNDIDQKQIKKLSQATSPQNARQCLEIIKGDECLKKTTYSLLRLAIHPQILRQRQKVQKPRDPVLEIGSLVEKHGGKYTNEFEAFKDLYPQRFEYQKEVLIKNYWLAEDHIEEFFAHDNKIFRQVMISDNGFKNIYVNWLENFPERNQKRLAEEALLHTPTPTLEEMAKYGIPF